MTFPVLHLAGSPYDQGRQHGSALGDLIGENVAIYLERMRTEGQLAADEARRRAQTYAAVLDGHPYLAAMQGVADGSGHDVGDILLLNVRYELLYYQFGVCGVPGVDGCTAFAVLPEASTSGHLLLGQNWDWVPEVRGAVVHAREADGLETLSFTEAGIVGGKIGLNSTGLGLAINGLISTADDWSRPFKPFHVRCWEVLHARSVAEAVAALVDSPRPCSANFLLAQGTHGGSEAAMGTRQPPADVVDLELAPSSVRQIRPADARLVHANHFLEPARLGVEEPVTERRPHTYHRQARLQALLDARQPLSMGDLEAALRDHDDYPDSICRHPNEADPPEERYRSVTSVIMDLDERSLRLTDGPPCEHVYDGYSLAHTALLGR